MPSFEHKGAQIYYEEFGKGFPILTFAPAGLASVIDVWHQPSAPIDPTTEFASNYRVIAMDQRNAGGKSRAPITAHDGWDNYTADHLAVLDHLGIDRCHLYGQCIGGSFILNLLKAQPQRVAAAVLAQPIGRVAAALPPRTARFNDWAQSLKDHPEATKDVLDAFYRNLYEPGFVYMYGPRLCPHREDAMHGAGRQRRRAPLSDRRRAVEAVAELRIHRRVEDRCRPRRRKGPRQGVSRGAHAGKVAGHGGAEVCCFCCYLQQINSKTSAHGPTRLARRHSFGPPTGLSTIM